MNETKIASREAAGALPGSIRITVAGFFALLPAVAGGGAMALPAVLTLAGLLAIRPASFHQVSEKTSIIGLVLFAAFAAWAALSSLWSPSQQFAAVKIGALLVVGLVFGRAIATRSGARLALAGATAALGVLLILLSVEAIWDMPLNRAVQPDWPDDQLNQNPARGLVVMLALLWPALAWLISLRDTWIRVVALLLTVGAGAVSLQFGQLSTAVGFGVGALFFAAAFVVPRLAILVPSLGLALWMLAAPFATPLIFASPALTMDLPHSTLVRIGIWRYTSERILEQPWIGHGLDAGRATTDTATYDGEVMRAIPEHSHSASLQIWFDTGAVGALLAAALIAFVGVQLARTRGLDKPAAAAAAAHVAMLGLMTNIGWSFWQEWWMATLILAAILVAAVGARGATK